MAIRRRAKTPARLSTPALLLCALVLTTPLAACGGEEEPAAPTTTRRPPPTTTPRTTTTLPLFDESLGLAASIRQFREDEANGVLQIQLVRTTRGGALESRPIPVVSVKLEWPGMADIPATDHQVEVAGGQRVDVPVPMGEFVCEEEDAPSYTEGTVLIGVHPAGAPELVVRAPLLEDAQTALDNIYAKGCERQAVLEQAVLSFSTPWTRTDPGGFPTANGNLVVQRGTATEAIQITGVDGSVLLLVSPAVPLPATMPIEQIEVAVPLVVAGTGRCDGHALGDSKQTFDFAVLVAIGDDDPVGVTVSVPEADRPLLNQVITDTCAKGTG